MYIKSIVIDGFKSYAQRTEVNGFDPLFNAITGLNGSGKSNILDSICFLLGISNLTQVRASSLQELVYKSGQAGITKATVSITFDNKDKKQSPLGYEQHEEITVTRQVVVEGRNKYLINGSNANNTRVQDLFRSVQLNVNNPHFLIMQGRITKVINMKPPEILSMIEEATGTRLYESKKEAAQKTIEKKDMRLKEIDTILKEEISPTLTKLKEERSSYLEYQKVIRELEHLNKLDIAYRFVRAEEIWKKSDSKLTDMEESMKTFQSKMIEGEEKIKELSAVIEELEKKRDEETGSVLVELENKLKEQQTLDTKASAAVDHKKQALKEEVKKQKGIIKQGNEDKAALTNKEKEVEKIRSELEKLEKQSTSDQEAHSAAQKHYQAVSSGLSSNADGEDATLNDQLMAAKNDMSKAETETKQAQMRLKHAHQEIKKKETELKKTEQEYKKDQAAQEAVEKNMEKLQAEMKKLGYEDGKEERLSSERRSLSQEVQQLKEKLDQLEARFPQLQFDYKNPEKNFDRSKVHGLVCKLVKLKQPQTALGLEVAAGGKLYNVVVDTEVTGKKLLQNGELKRRYTIIPLNKIAGRSINAETVKRAESLVGKDNVSTALSLIGYEKDLQPAMEFVFGSSFVCKDMNIAKKVTFDEKILKKSVTLDGNSFDPAGTLTGGARAQTGSILTKLQELVEVEQKLNSKQEQLNQVEKELYSLKNVADRYGQLKQQYELKVHEASLVKSRLEKSTHHQQLEEVNALKQSMEEQKEMLSNAEEVQKKAKDRLKDLQEKLKNAKALRETELKRAEEEVAKAKKKLEQSNKETKLKQQEMESLRLEKKELEKDIATGEEQLKTVEEAIREHEEQIPQLQQASSETKKAVKDAQTEVNAQKDRLKSCNKDISDKINETNSLRKDIGASEVKVQELKHKISSLKENSQAAGAQIEDLLKRYDWIVDEKKYFGQQNTAYDFETNDPKEAQRRIQKLQETKKKLSTSVNMRAMNMLGKAEEQYNDLLKKRKIVLNDKNKIAAVITELDKKKKEALQKAWEQVNKDFGSIFSTLLPGTQAKLSPPEGQTVLDGLIVKVAFGDVWKESLHELSGGQRSLVALSLILAMLLFKPAPIYILDEVDAALDLSHTQNIGQMINSHFRHSQFIVVSLKDGMFNNANVLFKTKFIDGVSTVTRYVQHHTSKSISSSVSGEENENDGGRKKKTSTKRARLQSGAV